MSKPKDKKREKERQRRLQKEKYEQEKQTVENFRRMAPKLKTALRNLGCDLPFYDYLDSYSDEFASTVSVAMETMTSLHGIYEVEADVFRNADRATFISNEYQQVYFEIDDRFSDYGKGKDTKTNFEGSATFFRSDSNGFRSVILTPRNPKCSMKHSDLKYVLKVGILLHELGHVHDAENKINIDPHTRRLDVVEAEAYAHCYALDRLAERYLAKSYEMLYDSIVSMSEKTDYEAEIGRLVLERHSRQSLVDWQDHMDDALKEIS